MFSLISPGLLKQSPGDKPYRWLGDPDRSFDIFFWQDELGRAQRFQIWGEDRLWEWNADKGWKFGLSDPQSGAFSHYQSPTYRYAKKKYLQPLSELEKSISESSNDESLQPFLSVVLQEVKKLLPEE